MQRKSYISDSQLNLYSYERKLTSDNSLTLVMKKKPSGSNQIDVPKYKYNWNLKFDNNTFDFFHEDLINNFVKVICLEFFRLFMPHQPKARLCIYTNPTSSEKFSGVLIKEMENLTLIDQSNPGNLINALANPSLIKTITFAKIFKENNLQWSNIRIDKNANAVYFDGEYLSDGSFELTTEEINAIPYIYNTNSFCPNNWLHQIIYDNKSNEILAYFTYADLIKTGFYLNENIINTRDAINSALLSFLVLPNDVLNAFLDTYLSLDNELMNTLTINANSIISLKKEIYTNLVCRKEEIREAIKNDKNFINYLNTHAVEEIHNIISQFKEFRMVHKQRLGTVIKNLEEEIRTELNNLKTVTRMYHQTYIQHSQLSCQFQLQNDNTFSRSIFIMKKKCELNLKVSKKHTYHWYVKIHQNISNSNSLLYNICEVIGLEFFRLFIPHQPKARLFVAIDTPEKISGVITKQIEGFKRIGHLSGEPFIKLLINPNFIKILTFAKIFQDFDLHWNNLAKDKNDEVVYFDGDHLLRGPNHSLKLTADEIYATPFVHDTQSSVISNWLHQITYNIKSNQTLTNFTHADILAENFYNKVEISQSRESINTAILMFLVLPEKLIDTFINTYLSLDLDLLQKLSIDLNMIFHLKIQLKKILLERKNELKEGVKNDNNFITYLNNSTIETKLQEIILQFKSFCTVHKQDLDSLIPNLEEEIKTEFLQLKVYYNNKQKNKNVKELPKLSIFSHVNIINNKQKTVNKSII